MITPTTVNDLVGFTQKRTCEILLNHIENGTLPHAISFFGQTGIGKTSIANIVGLALTSEGNIQRENCRNLGIADIREKVKLLLGYPHFNGQPKVLFLDELHALTKTNQEALLTDLENFKAHAYIFSATTKPEKIIADIKDRFENYTLTPPTEKELKTWLLEKGLHTYKIGLKVGDKVLVDHPNVIDADQLNHAIFNAHGSMRAMHRQLKSISQGLPIEGFVKPLESSLPSLVLNGDLVEVMRLVHDSTDSELAGLTVGLVNYCLRAMTPEAQAVIKSFGSGDLSSPLVKGDFVCKLLKALDNYPKRG